MNDCQSLTNYSKMLEILNWERSSDSPIPEIETSVGRAPLSPQ